MHRTLIYGANRDNMQNQIRIIFCYGKGRRLLRYRISFPTHTDWPPHSAIGWDTRQAATLHVASVTSIWDNCNIKYYLIFLSLKTNFGIESVGSSRDGYSIGSASIRINDISSTYEKLLKF